MLTPADKMWLRNRPSQTDSSVGDIRQILGMREDGSNRLGDLLAQLQATQKQVADLAAAVKVLQARP